MSPSQNAHQEPRQRGKGGPAGRSLLARLGLGLALIFLSFGAMNFLSWRASSQPAPYAAFDAPDAADAEDGASDSQDLFDDIYDVQPDQPADSPGALPPEDPEVNPA